MRDNASRIAHRITATYDTAKLRETLTKGIDAEATQIISDATKGGFDWQEIENNIYAHCHWDARLFGDS